MKKESTIFLLILAIIFSLNFISASGNFTSGSIEVSVDIPATQEWAEIELNTSSIDFGRINLSEGTTSTQRESKTKYKIRSRGNVNLTVTPTLEDNTDKIFNYLEFGRTYTSGWSKIGSYSILMNRTYALGEWSSWFEQSVKLDLGDYVDDNGPVPFDILNHKNKVIFWVMPRYE